MASKEVVEKYKAEILSILNTDTLELPAETLVSKGRDKGHEIASSQLALFSQQETIPQTYNLRGIHSLFAIAFLYQSEAFKTFVYCVKFKHITTFSGQSPDEYVEHFVKGMGVYFRLSEMVSSCAYPVSRLTRESLDWCINQPLLSVANGGPLLVAVDISNPLEMIIRDIENIIVAARKDVAKMSKPLVESLCRDAGIDKDVKALSNEWLTAYGSPPLKKDRTPSRKPETYLPLWWESYEIRRMQESGWSHTKIAKELFESKLSDDVRGRINRGIKNFNEIATLSFYGLPLANRGSQSPCEP